MESSLVVLAEVRASIYRVTTDGRDGDTRLVFDVPAQDIAEALKLNLAIGKRLRVIIYHDITPPLGHRPPEPQASVTDGMPF